MLIVYDMIPEVFGFNLGDRIWKEKELAISFASYYACISKYAVGPQSPLSCNDKPFNCDPLWR